MHIAGLTAAAFLLTATSCYAGAQDISPELRQRAIKDCTHDAMRLCPAALMDEGETVSCLSDKRPQLTQSCRVVYDQVARLLRQ